VYLMDTGHGELQMSIFYLPKDDTLPFYDTSRR
jgi:hypothetical protein